MLLLSLLLAASPTTTTDLLIAPPGCFDAAWTRMRFGQGLQEAAARVGAQVRPVDITLRALSLDHHSLFPSPPFDDPEAVATFLAAARVEAPLRTELGTVELRESPWELAFALPDDEPLFLELMGDRGTARTARLLQLEAGGVRMLALTPPEEKGDFPIPDPPAAWFRGALGVDEMHVAERTGRVFRIGKRLGTRSRLLHELGALQQKLPRAPLLHPGRLSSLRTPDRDRCLADLRSTEAATVGVEASVLSLSPAEVDALRLPLVTANVTAADGSRPFPRYRIVEVEGRRIAVVVVTPPNALDELEPAERSRWRVEDPRAGVEAALAELATEARRVDAVIGFGAPASMLDDGQGGAHRGLDVVVGDAVLADLSARRQHVVVDAANRKQAVPPPPIMIARPTSVGLARLRFSFDDDVVSSVEFATFPVGQDGPRVPFDGIPLDPLFDRLGGGASLLLPDLDGPLRADPALAALTFGEQVLHRGRRHRFDSSQPARVTDPVWMRMVTNAVRDETGVEVAFARNLTRSLDVTGPLSRGAVLNWLPPDEVVDVRRISGRVLASVAAAIRADFADPRTPAHDLVFAAGMDVKRGIVEGRPIDLDAPYSVAITRAAAALPELAQLFGPPPAEAGQPLRALVLRRYAAAVPDARAPQALAGVRPLLQDRSDELRGHWQLRVDDVSASGTVIQSAPGIEQFARSRETRATTPNLINLGLRADAGVLYNGALLGWENRLQLRYSNLILLIDGVPPREQEDEVLLTSEVRLQRLAHSFVGSLVTLRPYAQLAFDTEFTATPDVLNPPDTLPHQLLLRQAMGFAVLPAAGWFKEFRGGLVLQEDGSELSVGPVELGDIHLDVGFTAAVTVLIPVGPFSYRSFTEARLFVPDPDDRVTDLGVRLATHHRLEAHLFGAFNGFLFADGLVLTTKSFDTLPSGSVLVGVGVQFRSFFKL